MQLIDFHVHIDYYRNYEEIYRYYNNKGIYALFVTNFPEVYGKCRENFGDSKYVKLALGYNPQISNVQKFNKSVFDIYFDKAKYIGEVGLDYSKKFIDCKNEQIKVFDYICNKSGKDGKILSIHSRSAEDDVIDILDKNNVKFAVFHWYTGKISNIKKIIDRGYYFSINNAMLNSKRGKDIISKIPLERILVETDGPFTRYGRQQITPDKLENIYATISKFLNVENFDKVIFNNFKGLLLEQKRLNID